MFNLIKIIPAEDTYFIKDKVPPNVKLTYDVIKLNYLDKSPFKTGDIIFLQKDDQIYIWFTKYPLEENKVYIPESYILINQANLDNGFIILKKNNYTTILVIKNGQLQSQITYKGEIPQLKIKLKLLGKEYSLKNPKVLEITEFKPKYDIKDLIKFSRFDFSLENVIKVVLNNISIPLSIFFLGLLTYKFLNVKYLEKEKSTLEEYLFQLKVENKEIKKKIQLAKEKSQFWNNFVEKELKYPFPIIVITNFAKIVNKYEGFLEDIMYSPEVISVSVGLPKKRGNFIQDLLDTGLFKDIKILGSSPDNLSKDYEVLSVELYVKEWIKHGEK